MAGMEGQFGVFDGATLLAEFADDISAEEFRRSVLQLDFPEGFRRSEYNEHEVFVDEITEDNDAAS